MDWGSYKEVRGYTSGLMLAHEAVWRKLEHHQYIIMIPYANAKRAEEDGIPVDRERVRRAYLEELKERNDRTQELAILLAELDEFLEENERREGELHRKEFPEDYEEEEIA